MFEETIVEAISETKKATVIVRGREISFECDVPFSHSNNFALWVSLPIAMRYGGILRIKGEASELSIRRAQELSIVWTMLKPDKFRPLKVIADAIVTKACPLSENRKLMLYSGGVDSTFSLRKLGRQDAPAPDLLTVHGMDYRRDDHKRFARLLEKTQAFRDVYAGQQIRIRSNAASIMRRFGVQSDIGHGLQLFSSLFLFENIFHRRYIKLLFTHRGLWA